LSWLLTGIGLGTSVRFEVSRWAIHHETKWLGDQQIFLIPMPGISSTQFIMKKHRRWLFLAFVALVVGLPLTILPSPCAVSS
jgi:hypothetical protein